jgi:hypothetical protein
MTAPEPPTTLLGTSRPSPELVRPPDLARDAAEAMLAEAQHEAQDVPEQPGPHQPVGSLFLPVERATDEFQQTFGRRPSQLRACIALMRGLELLDAALISRTE